MKRINLNKLALDIASRELGKKEVNIGQVKEVLSHALDLLSEENPASVLALLEKRRGCYWGDD